MQEPTARSPRHWQGPVRLALFYLGVLLLAVGLTILAVGALNST